MLEVYYFAKFVCLAIYLLACLHFVWKTVFDPKSIPDNWGNNYTTWMLVVSTSSFGMMFVFANLSMA